MDNETGRPGHDFKSMLDEDGLKVAEDGCYDNENEGDEIGPDGWRFILCSDGGQESSCCKPFDIHPRQLP